MSTRTYTCILCPNGCELVPSGAGDGISVAGALCPKGRDYAVQEMTAPKRTISSLVRVEGGDRPLAGVRLASAVPKEGIRDVMEAIRGISLRAPVAAGEVVIENILGLGSDVIAIERVDKSGGL